MDEEAVRAIARDEIASLCALVLRRVQEEHPTRSFERNMANEAFQDQMASIFGEALADFSGRTKGEEPGA